MDEITQTDALRYKQALDDIITSWATTSTKASDRESLALFWYSVAGRMAEIAYQAVEIPRTSTDDND